MLLLRPVVRAIERFFTVPTHTIFAETGILSIAPATKPEFDITIKNPR